VEVDGTPERREEGTKARSVKLCRFRRENFRSGLFGARKISGDIGFSLCAPQLPRQSEILIVITDDAHME